MDSTSIEIPPPLGNKLKSLPQPLSAFDVAEAVQRTCTALPRMQQRRLFDAIMAHARGDGDATLSTADVTRSVDADDEPTAADGHALSPWSVVNDRCQTHPPKLQKGYLVAILAAMKGDSSEEAAVYIDAERGVSTIHSGVNVWEHAQHRFTCAATIALTSGNARLAGDAFVRAADCAVALQSDDVAAQHMTAAADAYRQHPALHGAAVQALRCAVELFDGVSCPHRAAKTLRHLSSVLLERGNGEAVSCMIEAAERMVDIRLIGEARTTLLHGAVACVTHLSECAVAKDMLLRIAELCSPFEEERRGTYLFMALVCQMACIPVEVDDASYDAIHDVVAAWHNACDSSVGFRHGPHVGLAKNLVEAWQTLDTEPLAPHVSSYAASANQEAWLTSVLQRVVENIDTRREYAAQRFSTEATNAMARRYATPS